MIAECPWPSLPLPPTPMHRERHSVAAEPPCCGCDVDQHAQGGGGLGVVYLSSPEPQDSSLACRVVGGQGAAGAAQGTGGGRKDEVAAAAAAFFAECNPVVEV